MFKLPYKLGLQGLYRHSSFFEQDRCLRMHLTPALKNNYRRTPPKLSYLEAQREKVHKIMKEYEEKYRQYQLDVITKARDEIPDPPEKPDKNIFIMFTKSCIKYYTYYSDERRIIEIGVENVLEARKRAEYLKDELKKWENIE